MENSPASPTGLRNLGGDFSLSIFCTKVIEVGLRPFPRDLAPMYGENPELFFFENFVTIGKREFVLCQTVDRDSEIS